MVPIYEFNLHYDSNDIIIHIDIDILVNFYRKKKWLYIVQAKLINWLISN